MESILYCKGGFTKQMKSTTTNRSTSISQRAIFGTLVVVAFALYFGLQAIGHPIAGVGAFAVCFGVAIILVVRSNARLFDERDRRIHERAAGHTVALYGWISAIAFPSLVVLDALDRIAMPEWLGPIGAAVIVFYLTYAAIQLGLFYRR